ncbi:MAG: cytochrome c biogenesis protein CcsA [Flavobacteriales bacterium]
MKLFRILFSTRTMTLLLIIFATAMGIATFVESWYGTPTAQAWIYKTKWFELIMVLLILNFAGNIERYKLYTWKKLPTLLVHVSFIIMFVGAFISRYYSFEGQIDIAEGKTGNIIRSYESFFKYMVKEDGKQPFYGEDSFILSSFHKDFHKTIHYGDKTVEFTVTDYIQKKYSKGHAGVEVVTKMGGQDNGQAVRESETLLKGAIIEFDGQKLGFESSDKSIINIIEKNDSLYLKAPYEFGYFNMLKNDSGRVKANELTKIEQILYTTAQARFVILPAEIDNLVIGELKSGNETKTVSFYGRQFNTNYSPAFEINGMQISLGYGSSWLDSKYKMPFAIRLNDFQLEKYPGSENPSSFASEVTVLDGEKKFPYRIFMNHVLDYKGYRFFQSSYIVSPKGEETTVLSVNADFWGTLVTYIGYFIMGLSMILTLFWRGSYFSKLRQVLASIKKRKATLIIILFLSVGGMYAQTGKATDSEKEMETHVHEDGTVHDADHNLVNQQDKTHIHEDGTVHDEHHNPVEQEEHNHDTHTHQPQSFDHGFADSFTIDSEHAKKLGKILVQDQQGRIKPIDTYARELIEEIHGSTQIDSLNAVQAYLSMTFETSKWFNQPIILVGKKGGEELKKITRAIDKNGKWYTSMVDLVKKDPDNPSAKTLYDVYEEAFNKAESERDDFDKQVLKIIQRLSTIEGMGNGSYFWVIPDLKSKNNDWNSWATHQGELFKDGQIFVSDYFNSVLKARETKDWSKPNENLQKIADFQQTDDVEMPSKQKVDLEILYNKFPVFKICMIFYAILGFLLIVLAFINLYNHKRSIKIFGNVLSALIIITFLLHTAGLAVRWYISGHAPWSNGYEAIIFVAWCTLFASIVFAYKNYFVLSSGSLMAVLLMIFSFLSVVSPTVTNLVPVLKSYWLVIHVAVIVSSYGFLGLSFIIGFVNLILMGIRTKSTYKKITLNIKELTIISELSMIIGLYTLSAGTFLGGVWANESWGRYWSWDPKETWAFISMFVYAVVVHMRLVPGLRGYFAFNIASIFSFASVLMTFLGVNYFLSGMHSYGAGDPIPVLEWVLPLMFIILVLIFFANRNERRLWIKK